MATFKVKKVVEAQQTIPERERPAQYAFVYYHDAKNEAGEIVSVEYRKERVTLEQLQSQLLVIQKKIDAIAALPAE